MDQDVKIRAANAIAPEEIYAELDAIIRSAVFKRSEKLQRFLRFVCETTVEGHSDKINEYLIGSVVFGRGSEYNPSEDSVVRRNAHAIRQKLQEYYAADGSGDAIRIDMPIGRYVPVFHRKEELTGNSTQLPEVAAAPQRRWSRYIPFAVAGCAIFALGWVAARIRPGEPRLSPAAREIWSAWIGADAVLSFSNPTAGLARHLPEPPATSSFNKFRVTPDQEAAFREVFKFPPSGSLYVTPTIVQTMMGEAIAATHVASLFAHAGSQLRTTENRLLSWDDLRRENHLLFGGDVRNQWVEAILSKYPFRVELAGLRHRIVNSAPAPGEEQVYLASLRGETRDEYVLISMLPGVAPNRQLLLLSGANSPAVPLATEYLTSESGLQTLLRRLRAAAPRHSGPWHFQAVIYADVRDKVVTKGSIVALRVL